MLKKRLAQVPVQRQPMESFNFFMGRKMENKQKYKFLILLLFVSISYSQSWQLVWQDEFDSPGVPDPLKWSFDTEGNSWDWGNNELQNYTPADSGNAWVENGNLIIEAREEKYTAPEDNQERDYTSARLRTLNKGDWLYGRFEIRAKMPKGKGTWPAIWMLNSEENDWPHSGELDIMEAIGSEPGTIYSNVWCTNTEAQFGSGGNVQINDPFNTFHIYSMEWDVDTVKFFVDSIKVTQYGREGDIKAQWPFTKKFHLLLNIAIGGDWEGSVSDTTFNNPVRMYVDYVRVYQQSTSKQSKKLETQNPFNLNVNKKSIQLNFKTLEKDEPATLKIYNIMGKLIRQIDISNNENTYQLDTPLFPGSYIVKISNYKVKNFIIY